MDMSDKEEQQGQWNGISKPTVEEELETMRADINCLMHKINRLEMHSHDQHGNVVVPIACAS